MEPSSEDFAEAVQRQFGFLSADGFAFVPDAAPADGRPAVETARWENEAGVFVEVFFDRRERCIGMKVGLTSEPSDGLSDSEIRVIESAPHSLPTFPLHRDRDQLAYLAWLLENFGRRVLAGDAAVFDEARTLRRRHTEPFTTR